jgi:hypothetical protein
MSPSWTRSISLSRAAPATKAHRGDSRTEREPGSSSLWEKGGGGVTDVGRQRRTYGGGGMNSSARCKGHGGVEPSCKTEALSDGQPRGAFYRVAEGGERTGGEGERWAAAMEVLNALVLMDMKWRERRWFLVWRSRGRGRILASWHGGGSGRAGHSGGDQPTPVGGALLLQPKEHNGGAG